MRLRLLEHDRINKTLKHIFVDSHNQFDVPFVKESGSYQCPTINEK
jgi:hypothetical protein